MNDRVIKKLLRHGIKITLELKICELVYVMLVPVSDKSYYPCFKLVMDKQFTIVLADIPATQKEFYKVQIAEATVLLQSVFGTDYLIKS